MSDSQSSDVVEVDDLAIKKRARRRLVGAAALALLAIIVLPLAMDGEAPRSVPDMQVSIPERGDAQPLAVPVDSDPVSPGVDIEPDAVPPAALPAMPPVSGLPPGAEPPSAQSSVIVTEEPFALPAETPVETPSPPPSRPRAQDAEAARVLALLNGSASTGNAETSRAKAQDKAKDKTKAKDKDKAQNKVFVQVGAFSDATKAAALVGELKKQGFAARAEKAGTVTRVRIGPLARSDGEQTAAKLKAQGRNAVLMSH